ncbi:glutamine synthetase [Corynebacterium incognita]|uniref:Glutamine synthetase n=2 Tax=Corynebacterium incognita TaxID=2754725 RepID=A0A7G7CSG7_9CORY|nr:glutamine synthetase [Corynebacterium incognita]
MKNTDAADQKNIFTFLATCDISARTKGRAIHNKDFTPDSSVGWVPANLGIGPLGHIVGGIPYGSSGDVRLKADASSLTTISGIPGQSDINYCFTDIVNTDGSPWESCSRTFLKNALKELEETHDVSMTASFEHEFVERAASRHPHPFSFSNFITAEPISSTLFQILENAGLEPECWLPEYAEHQYELTMKPSDPLTAADRALLLRDITTNVYRAFDSEVTFSPVATAETGGSGVHVHYGLYGRNGEAISFDPERPGRVSDFAAKFNAGVIKYAPALTAIFAPLTISYLRLKPDNWSTARAFCGLQNREALVRICPTNEINGKDPAPQVHFEFRGADAGANPWILMGCIIRAGLAGLEEDLDPVQIVEGDLDLDGIHKNLPELPSSLEKALELFEENPTVRSWFSEAWVETFLKVKRDEIDQLTGKSFDEQCEVYADVY